VVKRSIAAAYAGLDRELLWIDKAIMVVRDTRIWFEDVG